MSNDELNLYWDTMQDRAVLNVRERLVAIVCGNVRKKIHAAITDSLHGRVRDGGPGRSIGTNVHGRVWRRVWDRIHQPLGVR